MVITRNEQILLLSIWLLSLVVSVGALVWTGTSILQQNFVNEANQFQTILTMKE